MMVEKKNDDIPTAAILRQQVQSYYATIAEKNASEGRSQAAAVGKEALDAARSGRTFIMWSKPLNAQALELLQAAKLKVEDLGERVATSWRISWDESPVKAK
jgi:hypothetical protein